MTRTTIRSARFLAALAVAALLPLTCTACSSDPEPSAATSAPAAGIGAKWGSCMRDAGFEIVDPTDEAVSSGVVTRPTGADADEFDRAAGECQKAAGVRGADSAQRQRWDRQYEQVANCIRENGFADLPEQRTGSLDFCSYPRVTEPEFDRVTDRCLQEFAPDTQTQPVG